MAYSPYKTRILETIEDIKKTLAENDQDHAKILFDRLEKQVINKYRGFD